jgi:tetratricopeptide (TPR) repeat protein
MTFIFYMMATLAAIVILSQRKSRRWNQLIGQGTDLVRAGLADQAETSLRGALALATSSRGPLWVSRRLSTLLPLAHLLLNRGRYQEAAEVAVEFVEEVRRRAVDSELIARGLSLLGDISAARGSLAEAESLYRTTLEMEERLLGRNSVDLAPTLVKLGSVLQTQSRRGEAAVLFRRCSELMGNQS